MKRVIGGEFAIDNISVNDIRNDRSNIIFSSGRCALYSIIKDIEYTKGKRKIYIPNYLCDTVTNTIIDAGWDYSFYHVNNNMDIDYTEIEKIDTKESIVFLVIDYFGLKDTSQISTFIKNMNEENIIIQDKVQGFFNKKNNNADYSFNSLRKWFPCPDGACVEKSGNLNPIRLDENDWAKYKAAGNILKKYEEYLGEEIILGLLDKGEMALKKEYRTNCSEFSKKIFMGLDLELIAERRRANSKYLHEELIKLGIKHIYKEDAVPMCIPIFVEDRNSLRKKFFENNIFTPIHWPHISDEINGRNDLYDMELSLICDQRYSNSDIKIQIDIIKEHFKG